MSVHDFVVETADGHHMQFIKNENVVGAWLQLPNDGQCLSVQVVNGKPSQVYAGYRDGKCLGDKVAISYDSDGSIYIQVIIHDSGEQVKSFTLKQLEEFAATL